MLSKEIAVEQIMNATNEEPEVISPGSLQTPEGKVVQGFAALTSGLLCFVFEDPSGKSDVLVLRRSDVKFIKSGIGVLGKTYDFMASGGKYQFGGLLSEFEQAIGSAFRKEAAPSQPSGNLFQQSGGSPDMSGFKPPEGMQYTPGSSSSRGPVIAAVIAIVLVAVLGAVGYLFYSSIKSKKEKDAAFETVKTRKIAETQTAETSAISAGEIISKDGSGNVLFKISKRDQGKYKVKTGGDKWKIKVESDRVKVKSGSGETLVKIKKKDYGFKITGSDDETIFKGKYRDAGFKVKTDDIELGKVKSSGSGYRVTNASGSLIGAVTTDGATIKVKDGSGNVICKIRGGSPKAAAFIPFLENRLDAQVGLLVYFIEF